MITKKKVIIATSLLLGFSLIILYNGRMEVLVANKILSKGAKENQTSFNRLSGGAFSDTSGNESLDPANALFVGGKPGDPEKGKTLVRYINEANAAVPLTTEALQFALTEFVLGERDLLEDAIKRLEEGEASFERIEPPTDAVVFHKMCIQLLEEYQKVMRIPLLTPREEFKPEELEDDFARLDTLVAIASRELQLLSRAYGVALSSNIIRFYNEAIGLRQR